MTENIKKLYVDGKVVATGDFTYEVKEEPAKYFIKVIYDEDAQNPHENSSDVKWYSNHRDYRLDGDIEELTTEDGKSIGDFDSLHAFLEELRKENKGKKMYFPVYAYIHSGISLYTEVYTGPDARWDSGLFAIAEVNIEDFPEEDKKETYGQSMFKADFAEMSAYISGEMYMYLILDESGMCVDSCGGFYCSDTDELADIMEHYIDKEYGITKEEIKQALQNVQ